MFVRVITLGVCGVVGGGLQKSYLVFIHNISGIKFVQEIGLFEDVFLVALVAFFCCWRVSNISYLPLNPTNALIARQIQACEVGVKYCTLSLDLSLKIHLIHVWSPSL